MSFNDFQTNSNGGISRTIPPQRGSVSSPPPSNNNTVFSSKLLSTTYAGAISGEGNTIESLARNLQNYQQSLTVFAQKVAECKKRKGGINNGEKKQYEAQFQEFRTREGKITSDYNSLRQDLQKQTASQSNTIVPLKMKAQASQKKEGSTNSSSNSAATAELATRRLALSKIGTDINRLTTLLQQSGNDLSLIKLSGFGNSPNINASTLNNQNDNSQQPQPAQQQLQFQALKGQDVDEMILEERDRDIKRINGDIVLVNEMFKDMANIVQGQQPMVEQIHKTTEDAAEHAKEGLAQVTEAAEYQPTCGIM